MELMTKRNTKFNHIFMIAKKRTKKMFYIGKTFLIVSMMQRDRERDREQTERETERAELVTFLGQVPGRESLYLIFCKGFLKFDYVRTRKSSSREIM